MHAKPRRDQDSNDERCSPRFAKPWDGPSKASPSTWAYTPLPFTDGKQGSQCRHLASAMTSLPHSKSRFSSCKICSTTDNPRFASTTASRFRRRRTMAPKPTRRASTGAHRPHWRLRSSGSTRRTQRGHLDDQASTAGPSANSRDPARTRTARRRQGHSDRSRRGAARLPNQLRRPHSGMARAPSGRRARREPASLLSAE